MSNIDNFKARLAGGGARPNLFEVRIQFPSINSAKPTELTSFMVKGASLPASVIAPIEVPYRGRKLKVAGDRTYEPWTITVINDNNMRVRNAFEEWMNLINSNTSNVSAFTASPLAYKRNASVIQLDRAGLAVKEYSFSGIFPTNVAAIELNYETNDAIEEFTVELNYDYWTSVNSGII